MKGLISELLRFDVEKAFRNLEEICDGHELLRYKNASFEGSNVRIFLNNRFWMGERPWGELSHEGNLGLVYEEVYHNYLLALQGAISEVQGWIDSGAETARWIAFKYDDKQGIHMRCSGCETNLIWESPMNPKKCPGCDANMLNTWLSDDWHKIVEAAEAELRNTDAAT